MVRISIIAALGKNREIGKGSELLWYIPDDLKRFKALTLGHPCVMGRKTFESIVGMLKKPLPGRQNIVITRDPAWQYESVITASSVQDALAKARELDQQEIFVIGGAQIYKAVLPMVDRLYLTRIDASKDADKYFPAYEHIFTKKLAEESREHDGLKYTWVDLER
nr:Dihydrofolate reductase [uncultured bacterium]AIA13900.1 Dihydrofolate reductase [uncultured bacterium]AIA14249.1 Dihydrofolate reductase [uncultured bacterium]